MFTSIAFERFSPFRELDWRWQRARQILETRSRLSALRADDVICLVVEYLRTFDGLRTVKGKTRFAESNKDITDALVFSHAPCTRRAILQASILAKEPPEVSGRRVGLSERAVALYEGLFFNVIDRLHARCWILLAAINQHDGADQAERVKLRLLRNLAHRGGPCILKHALSALGFAHSLSLDQDCQRRIRLLAGIESASFSLFEAAELAEISMSRNRTSPSETAFDLSVLERFFRPDLLVDAAQSTGEPLDSGANVQHVEAA